ncbi:hypothetical protein SAMN05428957_108101 [Oryzisolibacter propanilivorax]|uniref:Uncharacterized protein n=1 Tax=Oryzisolibacter propanilivorax TaxID=1527607 RepID=A0A1G9UCE2_9BURK|nr:hypothetical protein [Oryzisolibacter propanilivorax]SDM57532.1 hypothetical protein SAMN05428957_108101 [Oryzisolibacter propanilivorax]
MFPVTLSKPALQDALLKRIIALHHVRGLSVDVLRVSWPIVEQPWARGPEQCNWVLGDVSGLTPEEKLIVAQAVTELSVDHRLPSHVYGLCASNC